MVEDDFDDYIISKSKKIFKLIDEEIHRQEIEICDRFSIRKNSVWYRVAIRMLARPYELLFLRAFIETYITILLLGMRIVLNIPKRKGIKKPPGTFLNRMAEFLFSKRNYELIFQPLISDMREEYYEALEEGRNAKAKWINLRYWCTFFITSVLHGFSSVLKVVEKIKKLAD